MHRDPYTAHLCAQDPAGFKRGFLLAARWGHKFHRPWAERIYQAVKESSNVPFSETAAKIGYPPTAFAEGFMLSVYGMVALQRYRATEQVE